MESSTRLLLRKMSKLNENISIDYLLQIIQELPDQYRLVFSLYVLDGYSHKKLLKCYKLLLEQQSQISLEPELF
jgi:hypothetical protein